MNIRATASGCVTAQLRAQYGIVSAGAFPPHATLVGSQHSTADPGSIVDAVSQGIVGIERFPLSLASHDLYERPDLRDEVIEYVRALPVSCPEEFAGDTVTLYRSILRREGAVYEPIERLALG